MILAHNIECIDWFDDVPFGIVYNEEIRRPLGYEENTMKEIDRQRLPGPGPQYCPYRNRLLLLVTNCVDPIL